jgi:hypothetical protein
VYGMEVEELAYVLDQLLEVNYSVLQPESWHYLREMNSEGS